MIESSYKIIKEGKNSYTFFTQNNIEYQMVVKPSGMTYTTNEGVLKNVLEISLNCDINTANKDYKTAKTIARFCSEISNKYEAVFVQTHNQPERISKNRVARRGATRIKLWSRLISKYFNEYILFTNLMLYPNKNSDILCVVIKKDSQYYKQFVTNFYRFCYSKMYKIHA